MRTKALLLSAALTAAGIATSMAQVYSVNAVGYVNQTIPNGYSMIANPFVNATNTLGALLGTVGIPDQTVVFKFNAGYTVYTFDEIEGGWFDGAAPPNNVTHTATIDHGNGVFILNPGSAFTQTWVGEVAQGNPVQNPLTVGYQIKSSKIPQAGKLQTDLGYPPVDQDFVFKYVNGEGYRVFTYDELTPGWFRGPTQEEPTLGIGESVFILRGAGGLPSWDRNFTVN